MTTHVIFDLGQTLSDVVRAMNEVYQEYARSVGKDCKHLDFAEGASFTKIVTDVMISIGDEGYKDPAKISAFEKIFLGMFMKKNYEMMPGALKLVKHLQEHNIPMAIATNAAKGHMNLVIQNTNGIDQAWFSHFVCGAEDPEVKNNKPAPDIYLVCAKRFNPTPKSMDSCVIFEDSIIGITGAVATGMKTVLINSTPVHELGPIADQITVIVDSLENFRPDSVGLPPYQ